VVDAAVLEEEQMGFGGDEWIQRTDDSLEQFTWVLDVGLTLTFLSGFCLDYSSLPLTPAHHKYSSLL
jgi:hypothetical protein